MTVITCKKTVFGTMIFFIFIKLQGSGCPCFPAAHPRGQLLTGPVRAAVFSKGRIAMQADVRPGLPEAAQQMVFTAREQIKARHQYGTAILGL